jgi:hypothetical protein
MMSASGLSSKVASTESEHLVFGAYLTEMMADERNVDSRNSLERLVGSHSIQGGALVEQWDDDLQVVRDADVLLFSMVS